MNRTSYVIVVVLLCHFSLYAGEVRTKLVIVGSGPAGLTAALYASRAQLQPIILEGQLPGGHLTTTTYIENWPGIKKIHGTELMDNIKEHVIATGAEFINENAISIDITQHPFIIKTDEGTTIISNAIIFAMGSTPRKLGCPGESEYWGKGIATCATCDAPLYKNRNVIVVGGGDSAMEYASFLSKFAKSVTIIQSLDTLTASASMQMRVLENPNIDVIYSSMVSEIHGNGNKVTDILITNKHTSKLTTIETDGIFIAIGHSPCTDLLKGQLELDRTGYIVVHDRVKSSVPGVFAAGDIIEPLYKQAITAAGTGCTAALAAEQYLIATKQHRGPCQSFIKNTQY